MSQVFTKDFEIECPPANRTWCEIARKITDLPLPGIPIRLILTAVTENTLTFECSFILIQKKNSLAFFIKY